MHPMESDVTDLFWAALVQRDYGLSRFILFIGMMEKSFMIRCRYFKPSRLLIPALVFVFFFSIPYCRLFFFRRCR